MTRRSAIALAVESVEPRRLFAAPAVDAIANYSVPVGKTIQIPITSTSAETVSFSSRDSSKLVSETFHPSTDTFVEMRVKGYSQPMVFELFNDVAPDAVRRFTGLVNAGFYNGLTFHRIINNFVIQGGDPKGDGTGGPQYTFDDEFDPNTIFSGTGQLAMANSGKDTNGSQFFITEGPQRLLDFNHTIFGQLVRGEATRQAISNVATDSNGTPNSKVTITDVSVIKDTEDATMVVQAKAAGTYRVKVTGTNADGSTSQSFTVTAAADTIDDPPILNVNKLQPVYYTSGTTPVSIPLSSTDIEGNASNIFQAEWVNQNGADGTFSKDGKTLIVTPTKDGLIEIKVGVIGSSTDTTRGSTSATSDGLSIADTQTLRIAVGDLPISATVNDFDATAGAATSGLVVASVRDSNANEAASDLSASIDWGDGTVTTGTVVKSSKAGRFYVVSDKTYAAKVSGDEPITVTVTGAKGAYVQADGTATVRSLASVSDGVLSINGGSGKDRIGVTRKGHNYLVTVNKVTESFPSGQVSSIVIDGYDGNDAIGLSKYVALSSTIEGGGGNDTIYGGAGSDHIDGGDGNDLISGGDGRDFLSGGAGNDTITGDAGNDNLYGDDGNDVLNGNSGHDAIDGGGGRDTARKDDNDTYTSVESLI